MKITIEWENGTVIQMPNEDGWVYQVAIDESKDGSHRINVLYTKLKTGFHSTEWVTQFKRITIDA